jgi:hypothetical protein
MYHFLTDIVTIIRVLLVVDAYAAYLTATL